MIGIVKNATANRGERFANGQGVQFVAGRESIVIDGGHRVRNGDTRYPAAQVKRLNTDVPYRFGNLNAR